MTDHTQSTARERGLNRRTLIKAGAHAAWVVPAVQLIGTAPAFAASGCSLQVVPSWNRQQKRLTLDITNTGTVQTGTNLTVTLNAPTTATYSSHTPSGFTKSGASSPYTFTNGPIAAGQTVTLRVVFTGNTAGTMNGSVSAGNCGPPMPYSIVTTN